MSLRYLKGGGEVAGLSGGWLVGKGHLKMSKILVSQDTKISSLRNGWMRVAWMALGALGGVRSSGEDGGFFRTRLRLVS